MSKSSKYGSHIIVLDAIFKNIKIENVFEYGCGIYSTKFFVDHVLLVESIEMQAEEWYEKIKKEVQSLYKNLILRCMLGPDDAISYFDKTNKKYDLVFVDGYGGPSRAHCVEHAFGKTPIIVVHDMSIKKAKQYASIIKIDPKYKYLEIESSKPHTGIYTTDIDLINKLKNIFKNKTGEIV